MIHRIFFLFFLLLSLCFSVQAAEKAAADRIFPDAAKGFISIPSLKQLTEQWQKTEFGMLMSDPLMDEFKKTIQEQITSLFEKTFGLTLDAITGLPSGEVAFGMIAVPNETPGYVLTLDAADKRQEVDVYLENLAKKLVTAGVKRSQEEYKGQKITVLQFPPPKENEAEKTDTEKAKPQTKPVDRFAYYLFKGDTLVASDQLHLIKLIADRVVDPSGKSLADVEDYQFILKRLQSDMPPGAKPLLVWYIEPLNYGESLRVLSKKINPNRKERPSIFTQLKEQGFDAVRGIGGYVSLKSEDKESVYRTFIYAKKPYKLAMKMFNFPDSTNFTPSSWVAADAARCTQICIDPLAVFDNFGSLFDAVVMRGEKDVWKGIIEGLEEDPYGPKINLREELIVHLGTRAMGMSRYEKPITINSESIVIAVELKKDKEKAVLAAMEKLFAADPEMTGTLYRNYKLWHRKPSEDFIAPVEIEVPGLVDVAPTTAKKEASAKPNPDEDAPPVFPDGAIVVAKNCLFVSTNIDYMKTVLDRLDNTEEAEKTTLKDQSDYKEVDKIFGSMGLTDKPHFLQLFARTHETFRPTYESVRKNQMAQSQAVLAKLLNRLFAPDEEGAARKQAIDGSTLPEFSKVEKYFGNMGIFAISENDGYFIKGFVKEREQRNAAVPEKPLLP